MNTIYYQWNERAPVKVNRENLIAFAEDLYSWTDDGIEYRPLCAGSLARIESGEVVSCILGELYEHFVGKPIAAYAFRLKCIPNPMLHIETSEADISNRLALDAHVRRESYRRQLRYALFTLPDHNDVAGDTEEALIQRALRCKTRLIEIAISYLE